MPSIPDPGFAGDDGSADPDLTAALAAYDRAPVAQESRGRGVVLCLLQDSRVLVPVVAVLGEVEYDEQGLAHDKSSDMAAVLMTGRDGRTALLAFTGVAGLATWNPEARPVPVTARQAALSAVQEQADALLLDVAGPVLYVVQGADLRSLAAGERVVLLDDGSWGWAAPAG